MRRNKVIEALENEQLKSEVPEFGAGDTVVVQVKVREGNREGGKALLENIAFLKVCEGSAKVSVKLFL